MHALSKRMDRKRPDVAPCCTQQEDFHAEAKRLLLEL